MAMGRRKLNVSEKARRVAFFRNGDYFDPGVRLAFRGNKPFSTMPHLLDYLSQKIRMPAKKIFSVAEGKPVNFLHQLEDGKSYVVSSDGKYESLPYGSVPRLQTSHVNDALPVRVEDIKLMRPYQGQANVKKKKTKTEIRPIEKLMTSRKEGRLLTIAARESGARATLLFNDRNPPSFEQALIDFGNALGLARVHKMSTPSGRQVRSISQLKNEFHDVDTFILDDNDDRNEYRSNRKSAYSVRQKTGAKSGNGRIRPQTEQRRNLPKAAWVYVIKEFSAK